jgi:uncharacterized protein DUF6065
VAETATIELIAYRLRPQPAIRLVPAARDRAWMDATGARFANRCLPLLIANQAGWFLLNSHALRATWDGGEGTDSLTLEYLSGEPPFPATSHFGHGILTWHIPYMFRTPPGYNLNARGATNWPKDGAHALDGIVETDWAVATFTMNWKITAINRPILFDEGEPFCMIVPQRRGELEAFRPGIREIEDEPDVAEAYTTWVQSRNRFLAGLSSADEEAVRQEWEKHYFRGTAPDGTKAPLHQTKLHLREFE